MAPQHDITQEWLDQHRDLIRKTVCPAGIPDGEFELFMLQCLRSGLDPLLKQAFCVPRESRGEKKKKPDGSDLLEKWNDGTWHPVYEKATRYEFQPSRDGMLVRANRFPDFMGLQGSEVYAEDDILVTYHEDGGLSSIRHSFNPAKRKGQLVGAWARVLRQSRLPILVWVDFAAFVQKSPLWANKPAIMILKVAEATALRKAYPEAFGGLYIAGERPEDAAEDDVEEAPAHPVSRIRPTLPQETETRRAAPVLDLAPASTKEPVVTNAGGDVPTADAKSQEASQDHELMADSIIEEIRIVAESASAGDPESLKRAKDDLTALGQRARKLPKGSAARARVSNELSSVNSRLFGTQEKS